MSKPGHDVLTPSQKPLAPAAVGSEQPASHKQVYEAYRLSHKAKRYLQVRGKSPEPCEYFPNALITNLHAEWRYGSGITLVYGTTRVVIIEGERLHGLFAALTDWKVEYLTEYDPQEHLPLTDDLAPLIRRIEILTERPQPLPPFHLRH